eukprot:TRINITY_DN683_c0_g1_i1.p1 TRINITY_DN683_c0_g1~~TRINITY_DN683_c0_g1_i1.p1  ORF type:complete len:343 (-),score=95.28 TRINITY_DN683_c0_g1_i1:258-1223(-)
MDPLSEVRQALYMGDYGLCLTKASSISSSSLSSEKRVELDYLLGRANIGLQQYDAVLRDGRYSLSTAHIVLQAVRLGALYLSNPDENRDVVLLQLNEWEEVSADSAVMMAMIYIHEEDIDSALRTIHTVLPRTAPTTSSLSLDPPSSSLPSSSASDIFMECYFVKLNCELRINRLDVARKTLEKMQQLDEDHVLSQLASATVLLAEGREDGPRSAQFIYQELGEKFGKSNAILNGLAACAMLGERWEEAEMLLTEAMTKRANDIETLANLCVVLRHLDKPMELVERYEKQLAAAAPNHMWVRRVTAKANIFDGLAASFKGI